MNFKCALSWLLNATEIECKEFPDACSEAARRFNVDYDELRKAYDRKQEKYT